MAEMKTKEQLLVEDKTAVKPLPPGAGANVNTKVPPSVIGTSQVSVADRERIELKWNRKAQTALSELIDWVNRHQEVIAWAKNSQTGVFRP